MKKEYWIVERENGLDKSVMNYGSTFSKAEGRTYTRVVDYDSVMKLVEALKEIAEETGTPYARTANKALEDWNK